ncbi:MAG: hypothetical protein AB4080_13630 [Trichodesmium sp.]
MTNFDDVGAGSVQNSSGLTLNSINPPPSDMAAPGSAGRVLINYCSSTKISGETRPYNFFSIDGKSIS